MKTYCIRGAITITRNCEKEIKDNTIILLKEIINRNNIEIEDCISILFTATKDITAAYPAKYAREIGFNNCSLLCMQEMFVENSLKMCIRCLITIQLDNKKIKPINVYLKDASKLRPDLK